MALGAASECHLLEHALGLGNQPRRSVHGCDLLDDPHPRRSRRLAAMDRIRPALGNRSPDQHFPARLPSSIRIVDLVSPRQAEQAFTCRGAVGVRNFLRLHHSLADSQLPYFRAACFHPLELRGRTPPRQRPRRRRHLDGIPSPLAKRLRDAPLPATRRDCICETAQAGSSGLHSGRLCTLCPARPQALHLLLGRHTQALQVPAARGKECAVPGLVATGILRTAAGIPQKAPWSVALSLADPDLPGRLLLRFPAPALPSSDRTRTRHADRLHLLRSRIEKTVTTEDTEVH